MLSPVSAEQVPVEEQTLTTRVAKFDDIGDMYLEDCTLQDSMQVRPSFRASCASAPRRRGLPFHA